MTDSLVIFAIVLGCLILVTLYCWLSYRSLVALRAQVLGAWDEIIVLLKQRADLLPALQREVAAFADGEEELFADFAAARAATLTQRNPQEAQLAEEQLQRALHDVLRAAQGYPQLQSSPDFLRQQSAIAEANNQLEALRRSYNGGARQLQSRIKTFPYGVLAKMGRVDPPAVFEVGAVAQAAAPPKINF